MTLTWFAPFFLLFFVYACFGERRWAAATIIASFFQGATPLLIVAGGRISGLQTSYLLLPIGIYHFIHRLFESKGERRGPFVLTGAHGFLIGMTAIGVFGAIMLPRVFNGIAHVLGSHGGFRPQVLHPTGGNYIQAFYMVCNFLLYTFVAMSVHRGTVTVSECIRFLAIGTSIAVILGIYQIACDPLHMPWPSDIINSNLGIIQHYDQGAFGITRRLSSTFFEPSMMAMHFTGLFALFALGLKRWWLGGAVLFCLLVSTSATAIVGLVVLICIWTAWRIVFGGLDVRMGLILSVVAALLVGALMIATMEINDFTRPNSNAVTRKLSSSSGQARLGADKLAVKAFADTWGLGVGIGSTRASSFLTTFAACTGIPGLVCFFGFLGALLSKSAVGKPNEIFALRLALVSLFAGWVISVPDIAEPMFWLVSGVIGGTLVGAAKQRESVQGLVTQRVNYGT